MKSCVIRVSILIILIAFSIANAFAGQEIEIESYERSHWDIGKIETVAVVDMTGKNPGIGEEISDIIAQMIRDEKYFRVMDRRETNRKLREAGIHINDLLSDAKARKIAEVLEVDGVIYGKIDAACYTSTRYRYVYEDDYYYRDGRRHNRRRRREVPYINQNGHVRMELYFYSADNDNVIGKIKDKRTFNRDYDYYNQYNLPSDETRIRENAQNIIQKYIYRFTPHFITRKRKLVDKNNDGTKLAMDDLWDEAAEKWKDQLTEDPANFACLKNLGIYYEKKGEMKEAIRYYKKAKELKADDKELTLIIAQVKNTNLLEKPLESIDPKDKNRIYKISRMDSPERVFILGGTGEKLNPGDHLVIARKLPIFNDTITDITGEKYFKIGTYVVDKVFDNVCIGEIKDVHKDFKIDIKKDVVIKGKITW